MSIVVMHPDAVAIEQSYFLKFTSPIRSQVYHSICLALIDGVN